TPELRVSRLRRTASSNRPNDQFVQAGITIATPTAVTPSPIPINAAPRNPLPELFMSSVNLLAYLRGATDASFQYKYRKLCEECRRSHLTWRMRAPHPECRALCFRCPHRPGSSDQAHFEPLSGFAASADRPASPPASLVRSDRFAAAQSASPPIGSGW